MISGAGFLAMLVLLSSLMTLGRYILEGSADRFIDGGRPLDANRQYPRDVVRNDGDHAGVRNAIPVRDTRSWSGPVFGVPKPQG